MKVITIIGARPQFIKASAISRTIRGTNDIVEIIVHTGQHYDDVMSKVFFEELSVPYPDYNLDIGSGGHGVQTGRMMEKIEHVLLKEKPDLVLVYGDTNSTMAGALTAVKLHVPVAHVEAGLRSYNRRMPEEINRIVTDHTSELLFAPTPVAVNNLLNEGIPDGKVHWVGDIMYDVSLHFAEEAEKKSGILTRLSLYQSPYVLSTIHRAENTDNPERMRAIFNGLIKLSYECPVVLPLHPRTKKNLEKLNLFEDVSESLIVIDPVSYLDMIVLEKNASVIVTDSGGVQKEAYFHKIPCVTLRDETEWIELVDSGWNTLVSPTDSNTVCKELKRVLLSPQDLEYPSLYGDGNTGGRIVEVFRNHVISNQKT